MEHQTKEREDLYGFQVSPGEHIAANKDPILLPDKVPPNTEIRLAVKTLRNGRAGSGTMTRMADVKTWLARAEEEEEAKATGTKAFEGAGDTLRLLVRLIQQILDTREIPTEMLLTIVVLIPKGTNTRGLPRVRLA